MSLTLIRQVPSDLLSASESERLARVNRLERERDEIERMLLSRNNNDEEKLTKIAQALSMKPPNQPLLQQQPAAAAAQMPLPEPLPEPPEAVTVSEAAAIVHWKHVNFCYFRK